MSGYCLDHQNTKLTATHLNVFKEPQEVLLKVLNVRILPFEDIFLDGVEVDRIFDQVVILWVSAEKQQGISVFVSKVSKTANKKIAPRKPAAFRRAAFGQQARVWHHVRPDQVLPAFPRGGRGEGPDPAAHHTQTHVQVVIAESPRIAKPRT